MMRPVISIRAVDAAADELRVDAFAVVMATGVLSVAARNTGHPLLASGLAWVAPPTLVVLIALAVLRFARRGSAFAPSLTRLDHETGRYTLVAACGILGTRFGSASSVADASLGVAACALWLGLLPLLVRAVRASGRGELVGRARGSWLLVVVGTEAVAATAAVFVRDTRVPGLAAASAALWLLGLLLYAVITALVVVRATRALRPADFTPDTWVLLGALASGALAGGVLAEVVAPGWRTAVSTVDIAVWVAASAWGPALLLGEVWRVRAGFVPGYDHHRWATVFPLAMYASACSTLVTATGLPFLALLARVVFWCALALWCAMVVGWLWNLVTRP